MSLFKKFGKMLDGPVDGMTFMQALWATILAVVSYTVMLFVVLVSIALALGRATGGGGDVRMKLK